MPCRRQAIILINDDVIYGRIYASLIVNNKPLQHTICNQCCVCWCPGTQCVKYIHMCSRIQRWYEKCVKESVDPNLVLTHSGRETHICVGKLTIVASDNGLSPGRRQAIIWTNAVILLIKPLGTNFNEMLIEIHTFSFKKMHLKMASAKWRPFCLGLSVLKCNEFIRNLCLWSPRSASIVRTLYSRLTLYLWRSQWQAINFRAWWWTVVVVGLWLMPFWINHLPIVAY